MHRNNVVMLTSAEIIMMLWKHLASWRSQWSATTTTTAATTVTTTAAEAEATSFVFNQAVFSEADWNWSQKDPVSSVIFLLP